MKKNKNRLEILSMPKFPIQKNQSPISRGKQGGVDGCFGLWVFFF